MLYWKTLEAIMQNERPSFALSYLLALQYQEFTSSTPNCSPVQSRWDGSSHPNLVSCCCSARVILQIVLTCSHHSHLGNALGARLKFSASKRHKTSWRSLRASWQSWAPADLPTFCRFHQSLGWFQNVPYKSVESPQSQTTHWSSVPEIRNTRVSNENRRFMIKMIKDLTLSNIQHNQYCVSRTFVFMEAYLLGFSESCWAGRTAATSSKASKKPNLVYFKLAMDMFTRHARHCKTTVYKII